MNAAGELQVRVARKTTEAEGICSYELVRADGGPLPAFSAGSHIDVHLPNGITRQYSLCNDPAESHRYLIAVLRDAASRGGSQAMHDGVAEGDALSISAPKNHFPLAHGAARHLLFAGGIGVTPILCMAERLALASASGAPPSEMPPSEMPPFEMPPFEMPPFEMPPFEMHYCARSPRHAAFAERIRVASWAPQVHFHFDDGEPAQKLALEPLLAAPSPDVHLYVCGPTGFIEWVLGTARRAGWPETQLHCEFFSADVAPQAGDGSFEVKLASSGRVVVVAKDETVVQALSKAGVEVATSCEQGVCGTCLTRVLEGECEHRDLYLTPDEQAANDQFMPCCSRARSARLVLDL